MAIVIKRQQADGTVVSSVLQPSKDTPAPLPLNLFTKAPTAALHKATAAVNYELQKLSEFKQLPAVKVQNLFTEALKLSTGIPSTNTSLSEANEYTILMALEEFTDNKYPKKVLRLVHRTKPELSYKVKEFDVGSGRAKLEGGFKGGVLKPVITEREVGLYRPVWGDS